MSMALSQQDEQRLEKTLLVRETIIDQLIKDKPIPDDADDRKLLIAALDGLDRAVLSKAKVKIEESNAQTSAQHTAVVSNFLKQLRVQEIVNNSSNASERSLPHHIRPEHVVEGEMDIGISDMTFDSFTKE